jgi:hypothetical protein
VSANIKELSAEDLAAMGFRGFTPEEHAKEQRRREAQMDTITASVRERAEARMAAGWQPDFAFEDAVNAAANIGSGREATIQMMTLACLRLARGWEQSSAFVSWWNRLFPDAAHVSGFACPCTLNLPNGQRAAIIAEWSTFLAQRKADA